MCVPDLDSEHEGVTASYFRWQFSCDCHALAHHTLVSWVVLIFFLIVAALGGGAEGAECPPRVLARACPDNFRFSCPPLPILVMRNCVRPLPRVCCNYEGVAARSQQL